MSTPNKLIVTVTVESSTDQTPSSITHLDFRGQWLVDPKQLTKRLVNLAISAVGSLWVWSWQPTLPPTQLPPANPPIERGK
jgi:hypothetical protein